MSVLSSVDNTEGPAMSEYSTRLVAGKCVRRGCPRRVQGAANLCRPHHEDQKARDKKSAKKRRDAKRAKKKCAVCGKKSAAYRCLTCRVKLRNQRAKGVSVGASVDNRRARVAERIVKLADGRVRYQGKAKEGSPSKGVSDRRDFSDAQRALVKAIAGYEIATSIDHAHLPRLQLENAKRAALSQAHLAVRLITDALDRNNYGLNMVTARDRKSGR